MEDLTLLKLNTSQINPQISCNPHQNPNGRNRKVHPKIHIESQSTLYSKKILRKKNKAVGLILSDFKIYYKVILNKII